MNHQKSKLIIKMIQYCDINYNYSNRDLPRLILNQFRWLDSIEDGQTLVQKLQDCLQTCELAIQRDIISCLPDIVEDEYHEVIIIYKLDLFIIFTKKLFRKL